MTARRPPGLLGRSAERRVLDRLLENVRGGQSAVLVVHGEAGVGKTALLRHCGCQAVSLGGDLERASRLVAEADAVAEATERLARTRLRPRARPARAAGYRRAGSQAARHDARRAHAAGGAIARLARDGRTNPQIGAALYISPRTVEWHLNNVFTNLGITSRRGLQDALASRDHETTLA